MFTTKPAADISITELAELFNHAFTGYIGGKVQFTRDTMLATLTRDNTDLLLSRLLIQDDELRGFILIARQGWTSRIAAMGIVPEAQKQGAGKWFLSHVIDEAKARGEKSMVLEAFEQNTPAVQLYKGLGFTVVRRLMGYDAEKLKGLTAPDLTEIDVYDFAKIVMQHGIDDLPWQMSATAYARFGTPNRAFRLGDAYALISDPQAETIALRGLMVAPDNRRRGAATRLVRALTAKFPDKKWTIPQLCPEEYGAPFFPKLGFTVKTLNQVQMHLDLR